MKIVPNLDWVESVVSLEYYYWIVVGVQMNVIAWTIIYFQQMNPYDTFYSNVSIWNIYYILKHLILHGLSFSTIPLTMVYKYWTTYSIEFLPI